MGIRAAAVAVMAVLLALSSCSSDDDLIGNVWVVVQVSDETTINKEPGRSLSFIGSNDEPALFVGGPCGRGTLDIEQGESGIRIVSSKWDAGCRGSDLKTLFAPDTALEVEISEGSTAVADDDARRGPKCVDSHNLNA